MSGGGSGSASCRYHDVAVGDDCDLVLRLGSREKKSACNCSMQAIMRGAAAGVGAAAGALSEPHSGGPVNPHSQRTVNHNQQPTMASCREIGNGVINHRIILFS